MQEKIDVQKQQNNFFLPQILSIQQQKKRLKCPNHNQAYSVCVSSECLISGLMCLNVNCQCRKIHYRCHHILLDRVLQSIQKHQKEIPSAVKETYKMIYNQLNEMIQKLSLLRAKFERQQQYFGLKENELQFIDLINQQKIDQINGKIINSLEKTFDTQIQISKNTKQQILKDFQAKREQFDKLCQYIKDNYTQIHGEKKINIKDYMFQDSQIIKQEQQKALLSNWVKDQFQQENKNQFLKTRLLFRASQNDFQSQKFHQCCDDKINTVVVVKNSYNKIIGGFTPIAWHSKARGQKDPSCKTFLFSLNLKQKYKLSSQQNQSIFCGKNYGPVFGGCLDLYLYGKCNKEINSQAHLGGSFNIIVNGQQKYTSDKNSDTLFTGNQNGNSFLVLQYQVFQVYI